MIRFHKEAAEELESSALFYESQKSGLGSRFLEAVSIALKTIQSHPNAWAGLKSRTYSLRRCSLKQFPYGLIYEVKNQDIVIWAVAHLARKPGYWKKGRQKG